MRQLDSQHPERDETLSKTWEKCSITHWWDEYLQTIPSDTIFALIFQPGFKIKVFSNLCKLDFKQRYSIFIFTGNVFVKVSTLKTHSDENGDLGV